MPSSAGLDSPRLKYGLALAALALAALALSLLLAFASVMAPRRRPHAAVTLPAAVARASYPPRTATSLPSPPSPALAEPPPPLRTLLAPWAFAVDALALLGLVAVLTVRR